MFTVCLLTVVLLIFLPVRNAMESAQLVTSQPVRVPYGRSVYINPQTTLVLKYPPRGYCRVDVMKDNPLSERNGFLVPDVFSCNFKHGDVLYTHLGSKFHTHDIVKLQIRVDTENETQIIPFQLKIVVLFIRMDVVRKNLPIVIPEVGGLSPSIGEDVLKFVYDSESHFCRVSVLRFHKTLPRYGELLNVTTSYSHGTRFDCDEFLSSDIRYQHKKLNSPNRDFVSLVVEILDKTLSVVKREYFQIIIRILGARVNDRPTASFQASNSLEVKDQSLGAVTRSILAAVDLETSDEEIIFNVSKPLKEGEGQLINLDDPYQTVTAFYQRDVQRLKIAYRPPTINHRTSRMFQVVLNALDAEGAISDPIHLLILVKATNVNAPIVIKNAGLSLYEGQSRALSREHNLHIADNDNYKDISLEVIDGLHHGQLRIKKTTITKFLASDLETESVTYHHDGSDSYSDNIIFKMTDKTHVVEFVFSITIAPVDDQPPYLAYNTGLVLDEGGVAMIDQYMLSAVDIDSNDMEIEFNAVLPNISVASHPDTPIPPPVGLLYIRKKSIAGDQSNQWTLKPNGFYERNTSRFTQEDIVKGRVFYRHLGGEVFRDDINFILSDKAVRPNVSPLQTFTVFINKVDDLPPILRSSLYITVDEFSKIIVNKSVLQYSDDDSEDINLVYTITRPPFFIDRINSTKDAGNVILISNGIPISKFTQLEVNHGKIGFEAPDMEIGVFPRHAQFMFSVTDTAGNSVRRQAATVLLKTVNNKAPKVELNIFVVQEFSDSVIDRNVISVFDEDTPVYQTIMSFTRLPRYGVLTLDSVPVRKGDVFTMREIFASVLKYQHVKPGESSDEAGIAVNDGVHKTEGILEIVIRCGPLNSTQTTLNITLSVKERSKETLTLPCCFESSKEMKSSLKVMTPPRVGRILLNDKTSSKFMVDDVMSGRVSYEHTGDETGIKGAQDHFDMVFVNESMLMAGRRYRSLKVMTRIVPVDNKPPRVTIKQPLTLHEGGKARLSQNHIVITDQDTRDSDITCMIDVQPTRGYFENVLPSPGSEISNAGKRMTSFRAIDIRNGNINYVQSEYKGVEPRADWSAFSCMDTNNTSPRYLLNIVILPTNDEAPHLYYRDFITEEGAELVIDVTLLNAMDNDAPLDELMFHVITPPKHGVITDTRIEGNGPVTKFTLTQIRKSTSIVYIHDGSETVNDSIHLAVSDGIHNTSKTIPITVRPVDDEQPRLVVNKGLRLRFPGESDVLTPQNLKATDIDSPDDNITFILRAVPKSGVLERLSFRGQTNISKDDVFTQMDVQRRLIVYSHNRGSSASRDEMYFDVTDGTNTLLSQPFYVFIKTEDRISPTVINKNVRLDQGTTVTITTDFLSAHGIGDENGKLKYTLTKPPSQGHLELMDRPGVPVKSFTQLDIASNKLIYVHTSKEESAGDSFDFEVADDSRIMVVTRRFLITLLDVDNKNPVAMCTTVYVEEGRSTLISPDVLRADDRDTKPESLIFTITRVPLHGMLLKRGVNVRQFSQADVNAGAVTYFHDGSDTTKDSFFVSVTDGTHKKYYLSPNTRQLRTKPFEVNVNISAVDNRPPQIVHNRGITDLQVFPDQRLGFTLDDNILKAEDRDTDDSMLIYLIKFHPLHGVLTANLVSNTSLTNFTQNDINKRKVHYVLDSQINVTSDVFTFLLGDPAGNTFPPQTFSIVWSRVSFTQEFYFVNETEGVLQVILKRQGFLGDSSFVRIEMKGVTARLNDDFGSFGSFHVQFSPGQTQAMWKLRIVDDSEYESKETLKLHLINHFNCVIGERKRATITILDPEDVPRVEMVRSHLAVKEGVGQVIVPLRRTGDLSNKLQVMCITRSKTEKGWAKGTFPTSVLSYSDFLIRRKHPESVITLNKGDVNAACPVVVIDDSQYEVEERFIVEILSHLGSHVNNHHSKTEVTILPDSADEPSISFDLPQYTTDESDIGVKITIKRTGTDLSIPSSIFLRTKESEPTSAEAMKDYIPVSQMIHFAPHVTTQSVHVTILDDTGIPNVEGEETFEVLLRNPIIARIGKTKKTIIVINDTFSDLPIVQFRHQKVSINEDVGLLKVMLIRHGDLSITSTIRCYTRQDTAKAGKDFTERTNTDTSLVIFNPGERRKNCDVLVTNDVTYEGEERFRLVVESTNRFTRIGIKNVTVVTIKDEEDKPLVQLEKERLFVDEPKTEYQNTYVTVNILRTGDPTVVHRVRIFTMDGTARAGHDYQPITKILTFTGNTTNQKQRIKILFNKNRKIRRAFSLYITTDRTERQRLGRTKTTIYIEKKSVTSSVIFPLEPKVVSLRHYDDVNGGSEDILLGYPLVCVTACDPKFSRYSETGSMCASQSIENQLTRYRWQSAKTDDSTFSDITADTFFSQTNLVTLDSVYITPGLRVRCIARAVTSSGELGLESTSHSVTTNKNKGLCLSRDTSHVGSELFSASISFTGARKDGKANMVHLKVQIPHFDGLIPIISTQQPDIGEVLSPGTLRVAQHKCSNVLNVNEIPTVFGFLNNGNKDSDIIKEAQPYQFSTELRGNTTVRFYKNLNLDSCVWNFESYFHISELIQKCGGSLVSDQNLKGLTQSQLSLRVPFYVSYVYRSRTSNSDWLHYDHTTFLRLTLVYDTAVLLKDGVQTPDGSVIKGSLWPISIKIRNSDKRLVVRFKTKTKFRGIFLLEKEGSSSVAMVMSRDLPHLAFKLKMLSREKSYDNPVQRWEFVSDYAAKDYTGSYYIKLIPCVANMDTSYSEPLTCNPKQLVTFNLPIRFQQIPDPVPARFTLSVTFSLVNNKRLWLTGQSPNNTLDEVDTAFSRDSKIYGRISLNNGGKPSLGYQVNTEKVFLCSSDGEFIPSYDPSKNQYGCLEDSHHLVHRMKVLDRQSPSSVSATIGKAAFQAKFASDDSEANQLEQQPDSDGFVINSAPLFEVPRAQKWFIHTVYSVSSDVRKTKRPSRAVDKQLDSQTSLHSNFRSSIDVLGQQSSLKSIRTRRDNKKSHSLGDGTGTNMKMIRLIYDFASNELQQERNENENVSETRQSSNTNLINPLVIGISVFCGILLTALIVVWILYKRKGRQADQPVQVSSQAVSTNNVHGTQV